MAGRKRKAAGPKQVEALVHDEAKRRNIPTAELQSAAQRAEELDPIGPVRYPRVRPLAQGETRPRDADLDPQLVWKGARIRLTPAQIKEVSENGFIDIDEAQLVWRGKDQQDWSDLVVQSPPLYIQEKIHPKAIIDDLMRHTKAGRVQDDDTPDLFADFNGIDPEAKAEFYTHDQNWSNRMILGDSLQVMASLAEREGMRGKVQCIFIDPPYGIKFNSNWQVSTRGNEVKDGKIEQITREPEQVRAFRDTWNDGIHSYLTYLRDRLTIARDLLQTSGALWVQIGDENVHRVRALLDEVFGEENFVSLVTFKKTHYQESETIGNIADFLLIYARNKKYLKFRKLWEPAGFEDLDFGKYTKARVSGDVKPIPPEYRQNPEKMPADWVPFRDDITLTQDGESSEGQVQWIVSGDSFAPGPGRHWRTHSAGRERLLKAGRVKPAKSRPFYVEAFNDSPSSDSSNLWTRSLAGAQNKVYVVQTNERVVERAVLMTTDPGDLVLDPTCGSGTTATVAEQLGRRWITIDTSRVALALARTRLMSARYPYYYLADSPDGRRKEAEITGKPPADGAAHGDLRQGFVYERAPHIILKSIANNAEIDVIWESYQQKLEPLRQELNAALGKSWEEWEIPREADGKWSGNVKGIHAAWWEQRIARQRDIDKSIANKADVEFLYDRPYEDKSRVRVAGPFTVESLSPHRVVPADEAELIEQLEAAGGKRKRKTVGTPTADFTAMIMDHLKAAGVQRGAKADRINFTAIAGWPGSYIAAEGRFVDGMAEKRAGIFIGPEFGTVSRADLTAAAREALDARFDALIACGFNFEAHTAELNKLGPLPILKAKMSPELHMSEELKNTGAGNLFIVFGEPDIKWDFDADGEIVVEVLGVDVFDLKSGDIRSSDKNEIAAWFIDTDYDETSFFVRHAYFLGANDPYKALKTSLKAEIDPKAWETLYRDVSRPFPRPSTGRFAVKVINHYGDEVMKVFAV